MFPHARIVNPEFHFRVAFAFVVFFTFVHSLLLPLVVSYDGMEYAHLANVLFTSSFASQWNFVRTPLFPLSLKWAFAFGGEQPQAALLPPTLFGLAGVLVLGTIVRKIAGGTIAAIALLVTAFYPILIGYQHMLLSETGIFFWLALLIWSLIGWDESSNRASLSIPTWIALVLAAGYYWRPTILYLTPLAAVAFWLRTRAPARKWKRPLAQALIIAAGPWVLAYPWMQITARHIANVGEYTIEAGIFKQVMVPPDDPILAPVRSEYEMAIQQDSKHGRLPIDGLSIAGRNDELLHRVFVLYHNTGCMRLIARYPLRYATGAIKSMIYFLGVPDHNRVDDENWFFAHYAFTLWPAGNTLDKSLFWNPKLAQFTPPPYNGGALLGKMFLRLMHLYTWLVLAGSLLSIGWLVIAIKHADAAGFTLAGIPLAFLVLHALTLMAADRYGFPVYPMMLANLVIVAAAAIERIRRYSLASF